MTNEATAIILPPLDKAQQKIIATLAKQGRENVAKTRVYAQGKSWVTDGYLAIGTPSPEHPVIGSVSSLFGVVENTYADVRQNPGLLFEVSVLIARLKYLIAIHESKPKYKKQILVFCDNSSHEQAEEAWRLVPKNAKDEKFEHAAFDAQLLLLALEGTVTKNDVVRGCVFSPATAKMKPVLIEAPSRSTIIMPCRLPKAVN